MSMPADIDYNGITFQWFAHDFLNRFDEVY